MALASPTSDRSSPAHAQLDRFRAPDGSLITLDAAGADTSGAWNCVFQARVSGVVHPFTVCDRESSSCRANRMGDAQVHQYQDTELITAYDAGLWQSMAAWRGRWHSLLTSRTGPKPAVETYSRLFGAFALTDTREGLLIRPRSPRKVELTSLLVYKEVPGIGDLRIERPHDTLVSVPSWRGATTRGGEMWRRPIANDGDVPRARSESLILATPTAVVELIAGPDDTPDETTATDFLADLVVSWTSA